MPGKIPVSTGTMTRRIVMSTAHDGPVFHGARKPGQMFANPNTGHGGGDFVKRAANVRGRVGFQIKRIEMTDAAPAKEHDTILGAAETVSAFVRHGPQSQHLRQGQPAESEF